MVEMLFDTTANPQAAVTEAPAELKFDILMTTLIENSNIHRDSEGRQNLLAVFPHEVYVYEYRFLNGGNTSEVIRMT